MIALGSQTIHDPKEKIRSFALANGYSRLSADPSVRNLMHDRFGVQDYRDCDLNDAADIKLDLGRPIEDSLKGTYRTVLDAGTAEHVFDIQTVFHNIHDLLCSGGCAVHILPMNWHDHGYVNFNPKTFHGLIAANSYQSVVEGFHYPSWRGAKVVLFGTDAPALEMSRIWKDRRIPRNVMLLIAYRKCDDRPFSIPYDIQD
jgi:hypothetical protein